MPENKSMIITAIIFGSIGAVILIFAAVVFLTGNSGIYADIGKYLGFPSGKLSTTLLCQFAVIFEAAAFIFAVPMCDGSKN